MADEETPLTGGSSLSQKTITLNIERIRFFGLGGVIVLLLVGKFVSTYAVNFPHKEDPSSFWDKLFHGAPSDFDSTETFIYKLFGFNHTCSLLDFNPSKTLAALVIMFHTLPCFFFVVCHYLRITLQTDPKFAPLQKATVIMTPLQLIFFIYFYMVFVNSPDGEYGTKEGTLKFTLHYIPYMLWQLGMLMMAIQQCWFIALKGMIPFSCVTPMMMWRYVQFMMIMFVVYTWFCWSYILGSPAWDTDNFIGLILAKGIMYGWDFIAVVIPMIFAWYEGADGNDTMFVFKELQ